MKMLKLILVLCVLQLTTSVCYGQRSDEMKSYLVKPMNREQVQSLNYLRENLSQYIIFQGGPIRVNKYQYVMMPKQLENEFLTKARQHNLNSQSYKQYVRSAASIEPYGNTAGFNFVEKESQSGNEECTQQLGEVCSEDTDCCVGRCKPLTAYGRSCQN